MIDREIFGEDERLELLDGLLIVKEPQGNPHAVAVDLVVATLRLAFGPEWLVRAHAPLALGRRSRPEPDVSVVPGSPRDYSSAAPTDAALVVEISQSRLGFDRTRKASIYGRANVRDYWVVNLVERVVEVHRDPAAAEPPRRGWGYRSIRTFRPGTSITPLARPPASPSLISCRSFEPSGEGATPTVHGRPDAEVLGLSKDDVAEPQARGVVA